MAKKTLENREILEFVEARGLQLGAHNLGIKESEIILKMREDEAFRKEVKALETDVETEILLHLGFEARSYAIDTLEELMITEETDDKIKLEAAKTLLNCWIKAKEIVKSDNSTDTTA